MGAPGEPAFGVFYRQVKEDKLQQYPKVVVDKVLVIPLQGKKCSSEEKRYNDTPSSAQQSDYT